MWKSVPMACKVPTASSSNMQKPTMNATPAMPTAPRGKYCQRLVRGVFNAHYSTKVELLNQQNFRPKTMYRNGIATVIDKVKSICPELS